MSAAVAQLRVVYEGHGERLPLGVLAHVQQRLVFEYSSQAIAWAHLLRVAAKGDLKPAYAREAIDHWIEALQADGDLLQDLPIRSQTLHAMNQQLTQVWQRIRPQTHPMGQIHGQPKP